MREGMRTDKQAASAILVALVLVGAICFALAQAVTRDVFSTPVRKLHLMLLVILASIAAVGPMVISMAAWFNRDSWGRAAAAAVDLHLNSYAWPSGGLGRPAFLQRAPAGGTHAWIRMACQRAPMRRQQLRPTAPGPARRSRAPPLPAR